MPACRRLTCADVDLSHPQPADFVRSQILDPWLALVWNIIWCAYFTTVLFLDVFYYNTTAGRKYWLVHFYNWVLVTMVIATALQVIVRLSSIVNMKYSHKEMTWLLKLHWVVFNISNNISLINTVFYLSIIHFDCSHSVFTKVLLTSVYVLFNISMVDTTPIKVLHFPHTTVYVAVYAIFISVYQGAGNSSSQPFIVDWTSNDAKSTIRIVTLVLMVLVAPVVIQGFLFLLYKVRIFVHSKCANCSTDDKQPVAELPPIMHRDTTTSDVVLRYHPDAQFVDVNLNVRDDIGVKTNGCANGEVYSITNTRQFNSESDLVDYQRKNGFYCDFARSSEILHHTHTTTDIFCETISRPATPVRQSTSGVNTHTGSQIIVVKGCKAEEYGDGDLSDCDSSRSSEVISYFDEEDRLSYV